MAPGCISNHDASEVIISGTNDNIPSSLRKTMQYPIAARRPLYLDYTNEIRSMKFHLDK